MLSTRGAAVFLLTISPLTLSAQDFALVESVDRPLVRENPDELALVLETGTGCQIGLDLLADTVIDVLRRGGIKTSVSSGAGRDNFALRVALRCGRGAFLVEVDFVDRALPASPGGPAGPAFRYLPGHQVYGVLDSPQRTLAAAKRSVEAAVNEYLRANFTTR
jgi:hypothetical protein